MCVCGGSTHHKGFLEKATTKLDLQPREKRQADCKEPSRAPSMYPSKRKGHKVTRALSGREGQASGAAGEAGQGQGGLLLLVSLDFFLKAWMGCKPGWGSKDGIYFQDESLWSGMWGEKLIRSLRQEDRRGGSSSPQVGDHTRGMGGAGKGARDYLEGDWVKEVREMAALKLSRRPQNSKISSLATGQCPPNKTTKAVYSPVKSQTTQG